MKKKFNMIKHRPIIVEILTDPYNAHSLNIYSRDNVYD